jgi:hypothetical protein
MDDDDVLLWYFSGGKSKECSTLFIKRSIEGYRELLVNGHLKNKQPIIK